MFIGALYDCFTLSGVLGTKAHRLTKTGRHSLNVLLVVCLGLKFSEAIYAQADSQTNRLSRESENRGAPSVVPSTTSGQPEMLATNNPFALPSLTLTGNVARTGQGGPPRTLAELKQRLQSALAAKDDTTALEYVRVGLATSPADVQLLGAKAFALTRLHRFPEAIAAYKDALTGDPHNSGMVYNFAEVLLITGQISEYRAFESTHKPQIEAAYDGVLAKYFAFLEAYPTGGDDQLRDIALRSLTALPVRSGPLLGDWGFEALLSVISEQPDSPRKTMLQMFIRVLTGEVSRDEAIEKVRTL